MNSLLNAIRNQLCKFSGEDYTITRMCSMKIQVYFSLIGLFVLAILICCFFSALNFTEHLFHNTIADIGVGLIWGYVVTNLYVLLLYTITPSLLPKKERRSKKAKTASFQFSSSMLFRIGLVVLLAVITAQPLNIFLFKPHSTAFAFDIRGLLAKDFRAWLVTGLVTIIFLFPVYLKYCIRRLGEFYEKKSEIKRRIIEESYEGFREAYRIMLENRISQYNKRVWDNLIPYLNKLERFNMASYHRVFAEIKGECVREDCGKYEYWANPPYRTTHKENTRKPLTEQDFLKHIYPEID